MMSWKQFGLSLPLSLLALASPLFSGLRVNAQMTVSPLVIQTQASRNHSQGMITLTNGGNEPIRVRISSVPFSYHRESGFQTLESSPSDLTPYLQFAPRELTILPLTTRRIRFVSRFAPNLPDGEYRAVLFAENLNETNQNVSGSQVAITTRVGITVYVQKGDVAPELSAENAKFNPERNAIQLLVTNSGQATARPEGKWTLRQGEQVVYSGEFFATTVLPEAERYLSLENPTNEPFDLAPGQYQLSGEMEWGSEESSGKLPFSVDLNI